jgi:flagellar assembly FlgT-like protein
MKIGLFFIILIANFPVHSQWFEAQGQAVIRNNDKQGAKSLATQNALKKALLIAGASVSSIQQVVNGLLTENELNIRASGTVQSVEIVDVLYHDNVVNVTIRADVFSQQKQCFSADYRKGFLLTRANIINREQASVGNLYDIEKKLIANLGENLKANSRFTDVRLMLRNKTHFSRYNRSLRNSEIKKLSMSLANLSDSQYVLYSEIDDISFDNKVRNGWQFWQTDIFERNFALNIYVYNGTNGELVFEKNYHDSTIWPFNKRANVDVNGETFWQSQYGEMISKVLTDAATDIDNNIMCQPTRGKILNVAGNQILINLGARQGVKIGDEFSLLHVNNFVNHLGETFAGFNVSPYKVKVIQVSQQTAKAVTIDDSLLGNIQIEDLVVRY